MVDPVNEFLSEIGLSEKDLDNKPGVSGELETLRHELDEMAKNPVTVEKIRELIVRSRNLTINELSKIDMSTGNWLSIVSFFIPIVGIVRKWYQDQRRVYLDAQLKVFTLLDDFISAPDRRREELQRKLQNIKNQ